MAPSVLSPNGYTNGNSHTNGNGNINGNSVSTGNGIYTNGIRSPTNGSTNGSFAVNHSDSTMPIAICGMGLRLPGGINSDTDLYKFLFNKGDARQKTPLNRYNVDAFYDPERKPGSIITKDGYFIDTDMTQFDVSMFSMTPAEASQLDFAQRLLLEVTREAFESAGEADFRGKKIGSFIGGFTEDWGDLRKKDMSDFAPYRLYGRSDFVMANRVAFEYNLQGPSMVIKTACSSAAVAVHEAVLAIKNSQCSAAICCGANLILAPDSGIGLSEQGTLAPDGSCKTFDAAADGYARGEAVSALFIKRLDEAVRDGNPIRAIIRSTGSNADGASNGFTTPSTAAQEALIRQTYKEANLELSGTHVVECHGTGTAVGDPLEVAAVANCFGENGGVFIGSVKPNLGHSEGASGITSLAKAVLALENRTIIPNIKFNTPNPEIPWKRSQLQVATEPTPWPRNVLERMSINSFGIGGSNVHVVIDSAASYGLGRPTSIPPSLLTNRRKKSLLVFSANSPEAMTKIAENHDAYLNHHPENLERMIYTLAERRQRLKLRSYAVTDGSSPLQAAPTVTPSGISQVAFVFTGQGAQWVNMGRELMKDYPSFAKTIRYLDNVLHSLETPPTWTLEDTLVALNDKDILGSAERAQPISTALQIALVDLLAEFKIKPAAVVGHSGGETAGAYAAGALTAKEALLVAYYRGVICSKARSGGGMAAVGLGREAVTPYLKPGVVLACENSGSSVTLSGDSVPLEEVMAAIKQDTPDAFVRKLGVPVAYHSHHMKEVGDEFFAIINPHLQAKPNNVPFYSSVKAKVIIGGENVFGARYWQDNLESPVLFKSAITQLLNESDLSLAHLEIGPHSALAGPLSQIYRELQRTVSYASALSRQKDDTIAFLDALGKLYSAGLEFSLPIRDIAAMPLTDLPTYPWHYAAPLWSETRVMNNWKQRKHRPHELLGVRAIENGDTEPLWRNYIRIDAVPWLQDHCVGNDMVFPAAGYFAMAGEAAMQMTDATSYTLKEVSIGQAMVIHERGATEVLTTLRKKRLTNTLDSQYWEFTITSYNSGVWTLHCRGLVAAGTKPPVPTRPHVDSYPKKISSARWYKTMSRIGLNYGPRFTGLEEITAGTNTWTAAMKVTDRPESNRSWYPLHPTTMDLIMQSWTIASVKGEYRMLKTLFLPTWIEEFYVGPAASSIISVNTTHVGHSRSARGESYGMVNGAVACCMKGFKGTAMGDATATQAEAKLKVTQLEWTPDIDFARLENLMEPASDSTAELELLEKLYVMCILDLKRSGILDKATPARPHLEKYRSWIYKQCDPNAQDDSEKIWPLNQRAADFLDIDIKKGMQDCLEQAESTPAWAAAKMIQICYENTFDIIEGRVELLDLLLEGNLFSKFYDWETGDISKLIEAIGHSKPHLRILEVGAGTGATTAKVLERLVSSYGERLYQSYTFTDISSGFFPQCQKRFEGYEAIEYRILDASKDPIEQGFNAGDYDLIIAANVLHATPVLADSLTTCRKLLQPEGYFLLQELDPVWRWIDFFVGTFEGWWLGAADGRVDRPCVPPAEWDVQLRKAGFSGLNAINYDNRKGYQMNANIIARPIAAVDYPSRVTILTASNKLSPFAETVQKSLQIAGYAVDHCTWGQELPPDQDTISFLDVDAPYPLLKDIREEDLKQLVQTVGNVSESVLLWLSPPAQINCQDPYQGQILGLARGLRVEVAMNFGTLELDSLTSGSAQAVTDVLKKIQRGLKVEKDLDPDMEYAWANGEIYISRFHFYPVGDALANDLPESDVKNLEIGQRGMLQTLKWVRNFLGPLPPDHVELYISTTGMNFLDLATAMNIVDRSFRLGESQNAMGSEGVGYVTKVGADVKNVKVGDRVIWMGVDCKGYATKLQHPADYCVRCPDGLSDEDAAGFAFPYMTVIWSLIDKANLKKGQSVLIHSAAGGVGIAAIETALWIGAEIYLTVGTQEKKDYLMQRYGFPEERIFNSRDDSFEAEIMKATNGRGVDAVLNSLSGELLHASWRCVASYGCMLEIGKRDFVGRAALALHLFEDNRAFFGIDFSSLGVYDRPSMVRLLHQTVDLYEQGHIHELHPTTVFDAERAEDAFRYMQKGVHMGRIVIKQPKDKSTVPLSPSEPKPSFRGDVSYLLVGGLGGLGRSIISWMVAGGAKNIMVLSRSAGKSEADRAFVTQIEDVGCNLDTFAGDVADAEFVQEVIHKARKPIGGVFQMAMVLRDVGFQNMAYATWNAAVRPKIAGTWNMHNLLPKDPNLDFVLFSSTAGTLGSFGQTNYSSGNAFMDAFVQYRHRQGLPAAVIDISVIGDVGYVAETAGVAAAEQSDKLVGRPLTEQEFLDTLQLAVARSSKKYILPQRVARGYHNPSQVSLYNTNDLAITDPANNLWWKRDPRMAIYRNIERVAEVTEGQGSDSLRRFVAGLAVEPDKLNLPDTAVFFAQEIGKRVATFLMTTGGEDTSQSLNSMGVDSLVTIEIRNWWKQAFGTDVSVLELRDGGNFGQLGELAVERLKTKMGI